MERTPPFQTPGSPDRTALFIGSERQKATDTSADHSLDRTAIWIGQQRGDAQTVRSQDGGMELTVEETDSGFTVRAVVAGTGDCFELAVTDQNRRVVCLTMANNPAKLLKFIRRALASAIERGRPIDPSARITCQYSMRSSAGAPVQTGEAEICMLEIELKTYDDLEEQDVVQHQAQLALELVHRSSSDDKLRIMQAIYRSLGDEHLVAFRLRLMLRMSLCRRTYAANKKFWSMCARKAGCFCASIPQITSCASWLGQACGVARRFRGSQY